MATIRAGKTDEAIGQAMTQRTAASEGRGLCLFARLMIWFTRNAR